MKNPVRVQIVQGLDKLTGNLSDLKIPKIRKSFINRGQKKTNNNKYMYVVHLIYKAILCSRKIQWLNG